ncbi:hypothetical protein MPL3356_490007 [Mesorhizobium plurifarium]|uniref:Uncharacterized protein n=1 Tax=Mesorhizobium plurifarium TaxID=69974 RepID=A0A090EB21_MESPL|nr:hypothetical protein MPL3356_490007 [Mesorhizobium plurifarium]
MSALAIRRIAGREAGGGRLLSEHSSVCIGLVQRQQHGTLDAIGKGRTLTNCSKRLFGKSENSISVAGS